MKARTGRRRGDGAETTGRHGLDRLHARADRSARRNQILGVGLVLLVLAAVVTLIALQGRDEAKTTGERPAPTAREAEPTPAATARRRLATLARAEGSIHWPRAPEKERREGDDIWDDEGLECGPESGGLLRLVDGGRIEFGPSTRISFDRGDRFGLHCEQGFLALQFGKSLPEGVIDLAGLARLEPESGLRVVVLAPSSAAASRRTLMLHVRRGRGRLFLGAESIPLETSTSLGLRFDVEQGVWTEAGRVILAPGTEAAERATLVIAGASRQVDPARSLQELEPVDRILVHDLAGQAKALADGETVGVDMQIHLREQGLIDLGLQLDGIAPGEPDARLSLVDGGRLLSESTLAALDEADLPVDRRRLGRLLEDWLLPVTTGTDRTRFLAYQVAPETLALYAGCEVDLPDSLVGRTVHLAPTIVSRHVLMLRAIVRALDCRIVEDGGYGIRLLPSGD